MYSLSRLDHNFTYHGPTEDIGDLSCRVDGGVVCSHWRPTEDELKLLNEGGCLELAIVGHPIPPVSLIVVKADQPEVESTWKRPREGDGSGDPE